MASIAQAVTDAATSAMEKLNIGNGTGATDDSHTLSASEGRRLYIGNLAYSTTEDELKEFFKGYNVESVSIPTNPRTSRAVGYAFVDVATKEEADRAIGELSGKEVLERKVSVQVARRPGSAAPATSGEETDGANNEDRPKRGRGGLRGGRAGRGRGTRRRGDSTRGATKEGEANAITGEAPSDPVAATTTTTTTTETAATTDDVEATKEARSSTKENREPREKKKRGPPENGVASTTKVMVANLPYDLSEESLKELFAAYNPESAKIALRPIPRFMVRKLQARNEPRKGRGFGFVTLPSEELQQKAVEEMNGKEIAGREIAVKVAIDNPKAEGEENELHGGQAAEGAEKPAEEEALPVLAS